MSEDIANNEKKELLVLLQYLKQNPDELGWRGKFKPNPLTKEGQDLIINRFITKKRSLIEPSVPKTVPDMMVSQLLISYFKYPQDQVNKIAIEHQHSMAAENMVGALLEKYIDSIASKYGWIHCVAELVKKTDFIKLENGKWRLLQVKNRDNSENSSSAAIREGTSIEKWFRSFSKTGQTNWENFPDPQLTPYLSEKGFIAYVSGIYR